VRQQLELLLWVFRDDLREGLGNEVGLLVDLQGPMPPLPGVDAALVENVPIPRVAIAWPMVDRERVEAAATGLAEVADGLEVRRRASDFGLPIPRLQSVEADDVVTWYFPLPVSGGDLIPGVSLSEDRWILGTSRELARQWAEASATGSAETGIRIEVDFDALRRWWATFERHRPAEWEGLAGDEVIPELAEDGAFQAGVEEELGRIERFSYRHWMEDGRPRSTWWLVRSAE